MRTVSPVASQLSPGKRSPAMRAAVFSAGGCCRFEKVPLPSPGPGEIRVRIAGCALTPALLTLWTGCGPYPSHPGGLTQEAWGVVDAIGEGVTQFSPGDRVGILSRYALAEYAVVDEDYAITLPDSLEETPFLAASLSCAVNVFKQSQINAGNHVIIIGQGFLGLQLTQLAALAQAEVTVLNRRASPLRLARRFGAHRAIQEPHYEEATAIATRLRRQTGGRLGDIVIEATGEEAALNLAAELARDQGHLVIAGYHHCGPRVVDLRLWNLKGLRVTNPHETRLFPNRRTLKEAVDAVASGLITPGPLLTHVFPPDRLPEGIELLRLRPEGYLRAILDLRNF